MRPHRLLLPAAILLFSTSVTPCHALLLLLSPLHQHHVHRQKTIIKTPPSSPRTPGLFSTAPSSTISKQDEKPAIASIDGCKNSDAINKEELVKELGAAFAHKLFELEEYRRKNGHCLVPKRYESNPSLGNWVNKQRQNYRKFLKGEKTSMNEKRRSALNDIGFVWNASTAPRSIHNDMWQKMYDELSQFHATNGHCQVPSRSSLGQWVVRQRFLYRQYPNATKQSSLTEERITLLNDLNFPWTTRSEQLWERRISELREFKEQHNHVMVPRNYPEKPQLSAWVATQRKNYNRRQAGKTSPLTMKRIKELEDMGFVWSYWDFNFNERFNIN